MYDGSIKNVQDIVIGDKIMGDDSTPRNILSVATGYETMYKIYTDNNESYIVNENHILSLKYKNNIIDISVKKYLDLSKNNNNLLINNLYGFRVPVLFMHKKIKYNPYLLGYILGSNIENIIVYDYSKFSNFLPHFSILQIFLSYYRYNFSPKI